MDTDRMCECACYLTEQGLASASATALAKVLAKVLTKEMQRSTEYATAKKRTHTHNPTRDEPNGVDACCYNPNVTNDSAAYPDSIVYAIHS